MKILGTEDSLRRGPFEGGAGRCEVFPPAAFFSAAAHQPRLALLGYLPDKLWDRQKSKHNSRGILKIHCHTLPCHVLMLHKPSSSLAFLAHIRTFLKPSCL